MDKEKNLENYLIAVRAYNEAKTLSKLIKEIASLGYKNILIVDDCSTDETEKIVNKLKKDLKNYNLYYVRHLKNLNMGGALLTEFKVAKLLNKHLITLDGDYQHKPKDIKKFLEIENYNVLFGNRYLGKAYKLPLYRKILHFLNKIFNFIFSGKILNDIHNGFRAYNKEVLELFEKNLIYFDGAYADNIFYITAKYNLKYKEIPVEIEYNEETLKKGQKVYKTFVKILIKSFLLRFFDLKKLFILSFLASLFFNLLLFFIFYFLDRFNKNVLPILILNFFILLGSIYSALALWYKLVKKDKEFKNFVSEESIRNYFNY